MPVTYIDIESRSACDLKKCGQYVYAAHPTTEITIVAWAVDGGPVSIWLPPRYNWNPAPSVFSLVPERYTVHVGGAIPADLLASIEHDPMAHNASFERIMLSGPPGRRLGFPADVARIARWDCTAARAAAVGLPRTLAGACGALGLAVQKDKDGHALMLKMCKPRKPRKAEVQANELLGGPMPLLWVDDFASMLREAVYCARDVEAERAIDRVIPRLRPEERETWECTEEANDHGAPVDVALLGAMLRVIDAAEGRINGQISARTGGVVPKVSDHGALTKWLVAQGIDDAKESGVGKQAIAAMIENEAEDSLVREVLAMRRDGGGVSPKKWRAILSRLSDDGRLRGSLVYGGAASTLRWSSRGAQLHNLPRGGSVKNVDAAVRDVVAGVDLDTIAERHGPPLVVASELLRPAFCAPDGFWVARGDYSQIEARVNPWLAGATWKLDAFRRYDTITGWTEKKGKPVPLRAGPDLYKVSASGIYRVSVEQVSDQQRQIGKVGELALGFQGGKGAFQAMARGYGVKVSDEQADEIKLAWRAANPEVVGFWRGLNSAAIECMRRPIGEQVDVWTLDSEWNPWHRTPLFFKRSRAALGLRLPSGRSICYWTPQLRDVDTPWGRRPAVLYRSEDSVTKQWRQFTAYGGILCENCLTGDTIAVTQHGGKRLDSITADDLVWDGVEWVRHGGVISKGVQNVVEFAGVRITPDHKVLTGAGMVANQDTTAAEAWRTFSEHYRLPAIHACGGVFPGVQHGPPGGVALPVRLRRTQRYDIAGFLARVGAILRLFNLVNEVRGDARTDRKTRHVAASGVRGLAVHAIPVPQPKPQGVRQLRRAWHTGLRCLANVRGFLARHGADLLSRAFVGQNEQQRRVLPGQLSVDFDARAIAQHSAERVPGNTVGAHNGVAGGGLGRHKPDDALLSHGKQVAGGQDVREAEQRAPGDCAEVFDIINAGPRHRFTVIGADGRPFIVSNCVQATARDVMAFAWRNARAAGMRPFLSVHDELICLLPKTREAAGGGNHPFYPTAEEAAQAVESIMRQAPPWARGLPIAADSSAGPRYVKA